MIGVVGGVVAALLWGTSGVAAARSSRLVGAEVALGWVYLVGLLAVIPVAAADGLPEPGGETYGWTALAAVAAVSSLYLMYAALRRGPVVLVMPITAAQGGIAALIAVALGERLEPLAGVGLAAVTLGMLAVIRPPRGVESSSHPTVAIVLAGLCAALSGFALYGSARASDSLGTPWLLLAVRTAGVLALTLPLALSGRLRAPGPALRLVVFCGLADTAAFASFIVAAGQGSIAVPAVIASQFAAVSVLLGVLAIRERLTRTQLAGVLGILGGVALVTAVQS